MRSTLEGTLVLRVLLSLLLATAVGTTEPQSPATAPRVQLQQAKATLTLVQYARFVGQFEGRRLTVYRDSRGRSTIGAGHRCTRSHAPLTDAQVDQVLVLDVHAAGRGARALVVGFDQLPDAVQLIVVDMVFNLGRTGFSSFTSFRSALARRDWHAAACALADSDWYIQVPARSAVHHRTLESLHE